VRLNSIKLSGFKSFAEPTHFLLPGQLVGVVGPNGCGKSNIIDAVRWVLGESRASELRGESMQDVIFNGTTSRKPANRASVELIFDNADHRAGGQWAQFAEIAVKRVLSRDGTSSYYINNQPVRRRDVQDVFLGTGLGPRAYAIIGQGTISRIIESKPEELRLFLEEAAGVSKYKERRRETANRLQDTRENLTRVEDILRELGGQLERLERQAEVAVRYKDLQAQGVLKQQQLWFIKRADSQDEQLRLQGQYDQAVNSLEGRLADLRRIEAELETLRQSHYEAGDQVNQAQGRLYEAGAEVARLEAEIRYVVEGRQRAQQRLSQLAEQAQEWTSRKQGDTAQLLDLEAGSGQAQEQAALVQAQLEEQGGQMPELEEALRQAQAASTAQRQLVSQVQQQIQVLAAEQRSTEEAGRGLLNRRERLDNDKRALDAPDEARLGQVRQQVIEMAAAQDTLQAQLVELSQRAPELDEERRQQQQTVNQESARLSDLSARLQALRALQEKVKTDGRLAPWLARHGLEGLQGLWNRLHVEPGWESAIEAALRERLGALEVSRLDMVRGFAGAQGHDGPPAKLAFFSPPAQAPQAKAAPGLRPLAELIRQPDAALSWLLADWLQGAFAADSLEQALSLRGQLQPGQVLYVAAGHAVGRHAVTFYAADSEQSGLLARAQEIDNLDKQQRAQALIVEQSRSALVRAEADYAAASQRLQSLQRDAAAGQSQLHTLEVEVLRLQQLAEQTRQRSEQFDADLLEIDQQLEQLQERRLADQARFEELDMQLADSQERQAQLDERTLLAQDGLDRGREQQRALERQAQEAQFGLRTLQLRAEELRRGLQTADGQLVQIAQEQERANEELARLSDAAAQSGLQAALAVRLEREADLGVRRSHYDDLTTKLRACDERRLQIERELDPMRQRITDLQLRQQAARLGFEQYEQLLLDAQADLQALEASIEHSGVKLAGLQAEIDRLQREIQGLGAVNLAALEELDAARERKGFLDAQSQDLTEAMNTLEDAIRKIDMETRELLSSTFETVNLHFGKMFPQLFGGGTARLIMTGDEILDAGVQVMAQPPGKKNQTIHLLSGGEKALTAIALVFAIFQLNPAPFCLLDEVDAPLDDSNTERYSRLVTSMSSDTQFLFISHNKIAMEMAQQLIGVTMQEQGVSRIVAVDMESAAQLAEPVSS